MTVPLLYLLLSTYKDIAAIAINTNTTTFNNNTSITTTNINTTIITFTKYC